MDCRGLVDPDNLPFGHVLPLEIQVRIMFWVHCFRTIELRKKVLVQFEALPKCSITGFPRKLGDEEYWNQVVFRIQTTRSNGCHHCHRIYDHRLSLSIFLDGEKGNEKKTR